MCALALGLRGVLGRGGRGAVFGAHYPLGTAATLLRERQIFRRLCVRQISCHSAETFSRPRKRNLRIPRADLVIPNTGSTMCLRAAYSAWPAGKRSFSRIFSFTVASAE